jgi:hypothetical protein
MTSEVQRFDITGNPGSGKFTLTFKTQTTTEIDHHPPAGDVERALEALPSIGTGNITVTKDGNWGYVCEFLGNLANQDVPELTADDSQLPEGAAVTVTTMIQGGTGLKGPTATLATPCTLTDLLGFATHIVPVTSGDHHNATVTSTDSAITVSY